MHRNGAFSTDLRYSTLQSCSDFRISCELNRAEFYC
jgi:hypothetical protein